MRIWISRLSLVIAGLTTLLLALSFPAPRYATPLSTPPESKPWGLYELMVADLDGNLLRVFYDFETPARAATP